MFPCHLLGRGSAFETAVLEILRGDGGYLLPHLSIELLSICALDRLPLLIGERDPNVVRVSVRDRNRRPPLRHGPTVTTVPLERVARSKHPDGEGMRRLAGRPRAFQNSIASATCCGPAACGLAGRPVSASATCAWPLPGGGQSRAR